MHSKKTFIIIFFTTSFLAFGNFFSTQAQPPTITSFSPTTVCQGDAVTITGSNFTGATSVKLGSGNASSFAINDATSITAYVANTATNGTVTVTTPGGTATGPGTLSILPAPRPALMDVSTLDIPFTNCTGSSTYQLTVRNNSTTTGTGNIYLIDWGDAQPFFTETNWPSGAQTSHTYQSQGYFNIVLSIKAPNGCTKSVTYNFYNGRNGRATFTPNSPTTGLCAPATVTFKIDDWFNNSKGTTYKIVFGDGSRDTTLQHPPNLTNTAELVPHTYTTTSCPATDFTAKLDVINGCFTTTYTVNQIVVRKKPIADFSTQPTPACINTPVCFTNLVTTGYSGTSCNTTTSYLWDFGDNTTSTLANPPCHTYPTVGTYNVTLTVSNAGCGSDTKTKQITINPSPDPPIASSNSPVCSGGTLNLFATAISGATYSWKGPGSYFSNLQNPTRTNVTAAMSGTYTVTVTVDGCTSIAASVNVVINQTAAAPTATSPVNYCQFATADPLTATASPGNTLLWYTDAVAGTGSPTAPTPPTDVVRSLTYYASQINSTTKCESPRKPIIVNIREIPNISSGSFTNPTSCASSTGSIALSGLSPTVDYIISYEKNGVLQPPINLRSNGSGVITIGGLSAGSYDKVKATSNNCASNVVGPFELTDPTPPPTPVPTSNSPLCSGATLILMSNTTATTYSWTGPLNFLNSQKDPTRLNVTTAMGGTYRVTITVNGCTSVPGSVNVVIDSTPAKPTASSNSPICVDSTLKLFSSTSLPNVTYSWTGPPPFTSNQQDPVRPSATMAMGGLYSIIATATRGNCPSLPGTTSVIINSSPNISSSSFTNPTTCGDVTGTITLNGLSASVSYTVRYKKNGVPFSFPKLSNASGSLVISGLSSGTYTEVSVSLNSCPSKEVGPFTLTDPPLTPPTIGSNSPVCEGSSLSLTSTLADSYSWTGPGFTSGVRNPVRPTISLDDAGVYKVTVTVNGCNSSNSIDVVIDPNPIGGTTHSDDTVCSGINTGTITLTGFSGEIVRWESSTDNGRIWSKIDNKTSSLTFNNLDVTTSYRTVVKSGTCPEVYSDTTIITVVKSVTPANAGPDQKLCDVSSVTLEGNKPAVGSGTWTQTFGPTANTKITDPLRYNTGVTGLIDGVYKFAWTITGSSSQCTSSSDTMQVFIRPPITKANAGPDQLLCYTSSNAVSLNANLDKARDFEKGKWSIISEPKGSNGSFSDDAGSSSSFSFDSAGVYTLEWTISNDTDSSTCLSSSDSVIININKGDSAKAGPDQYLCAVNNTTLQATTPVWGGAGAWTKVSGPGSPVITFPNSPITSVKGLSPGTYIFKWVITNLVCPASEDLLQIIVTDSVTDADAGPDVTMCDFTAPATIALNGNTYISPIETGQWRVVSQPPLGNGRFSNPSNPKSNFSFDQPGIYLIEWALRNISTGCPPTRDTMIINVFRKPVADFSVSPSVVCKDDAVSVINQSSYANHYYWLWGDDRSSTLENGQHSYNKPGSYNIILLVRIDTLGCVSEDSASKQVAVSDKIKAGIQVSPAKECVPYTLQVNAVNAVGASLVEWYFYDQGGVIVRTTGLRALYTFNFAGTDSVKLVVHTANACTDTATYRFTVYDITPTAFTPQLVSTCSHDTTITFTATPSSTGNDILQYKWFINGIFSSTVNPFRYRFLSSKNSDTFYLKALAQNTTGCGDTSLIGKVIILPRPTTSITVSPSPPILQQPDYTFTFKDTLSSPANFIYTWNLGDKSRQTRDGKEITYTYGDTGTFTVRLSVLNLFNGCYIRDSIKVTILAVPGYLQVPNAICPGCSNSGLQRFLPLGKGLKQYQLSIYTSWGQKVFETTSLNPDGSPKEAWDETFNGSVLQQDAYTWVIEARFTNNTEWKGMLYPGSNKPVKAGFITVIK